MSRRRVELLGGFREPHAATRGPLPSEGATQERGTRDERWHRGAGEGQKICTRCLTRDPRRLEGHAVGRRKTQRRVERRHLRAALGGHGPQVATLGCQGTDKRRLLREGRLHEKPETPHPSRRLGSGLKEREAKARAEPQREQGLVAYRLKPQSKRSSSLLFGGSSRASPRGAGTTSSLA